MSRAAEIRALARPVAVLDRALAARPVAARWLLAGPLALLAALATMAAMPLWLPAGAAGVNDIALPILLTPLLWAVPFFYACLETNLTRCTLSLLGLTLLQGGLVAASLLG
jgi:hypothetical protein